MEAEVIIPGACPAPTELASVERVILHYKEEPSAGPAPTELASVERVILHYKEEPSACPAPPSLPRWSA